MKLRFFWYSTSIIQTKSQSRFPSKNVPAFVPFPGYPHKRAGMTEKKGEKSGMSVLLILAILFCCWPCSVSVYSWPVPACPPCQTGHVCWLAHTYRQHCPFNVIIADPHRLLSPGLTWTSASSEEGNVRYPQASVTPLHSADPKKSKFVFKRKKCIYTPTSPASRQRGIRTSQFAGRK